MLFTKAGQGRCRGLCFCRGMTWCRAFRSGLERGQQGDGRLQDTCPIKMRRADKAAVRPEEAT